MKNNGYMIATKAIHKLGDISREEGDLCRIDREEGGNYIGSWVTGFGFFDVKFPKETTRDLTDTETAKYHGNCITVNGQKTHNINLLTNPRGTSR
jgi:hypothetical protein